ncbi:MAG: aspartate 1-decarboxylase [Bradymonadales bacterium]|nr:MAG: aspartate 1-decarboxylase [Bradymonadales bacterium]
MRAKLHGLTVTKADLEYEGSFGIDQDIMERLEILPFEAVEIYNISSGQRLKTYAIPLARGSREFQSNGAAAHLIKKGDRVIVACYCRLNEQEILKFDGPKVAIFNKRNEIQQFYQQAPQKIA